METLKTVIEKLKNINIKNNNEVLNEFNYLFERNSNKIKEILSKENDFFDANYEYNKLAKSFASVKEYDYEKLKKYSSIGRCVVITNGDTYFILELIIKAILTKTKISFITENYMFNTNLFLVELAQKALSKYYIDGDAITLFNLRNYKEIYDFIDNIDCIVVNKNYDLYKEIQDLFNIKVVYSDYGNINIYSDSDEFDDDIEIVYEAAKKEDKDIYVSKTDDIQKYLDNMNNNFVFYSVVIFTKDIEKCSYFLKNIKAENVYINKNPFEINDVEFPEYEFLYKKKIMIS